MTDPFGVPHTQNTAPVFEFKCLYTSDLRRKQKRWRDGRLKYHTFNKRIMVYDERSNFVGDVHWREDSELCDGEELQLERGGILVQVQEKLETHTQDLTELVDKRRKEKEARAAARIANGPPASFTATRIPNLGTPASALKPKSLNSLLTPSGHHGRAQLPTESPFEERQRMNNGNQDSHEKERPSKRRKVNEPTQAKSGYAQNLTGTMLNLASSKPTSTPPIRYEAFKPKFTVSQKSTTTIDLTLDEEHNNGLEKIAPRHEAIPSKAANLQRAKHRRSPSDKSGYARNLTGTTLLLNRPAPTSSVLIYNVTGTKQGAPVQPQENPSSSSEDDESEVNATPSSGKAQKAKTTAFPTATMKRRRRSLSHDCLSLEDQPVSSPPAVNPAKTKNPAKTIEPSNTLQRSGSGSSGQYHTKSSPPIGHASAKSRKPQASLAKTTRRPGDGTVTNLDSSSFEEFINTAPSMRKPKARPDTSPSVCIVSRSNSSSGGIFSPQTSPAKVLVVAGSKSNESFSDASATSIGGNESRKPISSLRIKPRPPRKMMMLMSAPSSRAPPVVEPTANVLTIGKKKTKAAEKPVLSQATRDLDSKILRQQEQIRARLNKNRPRPGLCSDEPSPPSVDSDISHHEFDRLLTHNKKTSKGASVEEAGLQDSPKRPKATLPSVDYSSILTTPGPSSPIVSSPKPSPSMSSSARFSASKILPRSPDRTTANKDASPEDEIAQIDNVPIIARLAAQNSSPSSQLNESSSSSKEPLFRIACSGPLRATKTTPVDTEMSNDQDYPAPTLEKAGESKEARTSGREILWPLNGDAGATEHSEADSSSEVQQDGVHTEDMRPDEACAAKDLREKLGVGLLKIRKLPTNSPPNLAGGLQIATEKFRAILRSTPGSVNRISEKPRINESASVEQAVQDLRQVTEDQNEDPPPVQLAIQKDKLNLSTNVQEASGLKPGSGLGHRIFNDFCSNWQGSDGTINSEFALSIATTNQPKFKLSKPIPRGNPVQPLGPPPPGRLWKAAGSVDGGINGPRNDSVGGMPVTAIGPWSREAFDLFGSWRPPGRYTPTT